MCQNRSGSDRIDHTLIYIKGFISVFASLDPVATAPGSDTAHGPLQGGTPNRRPSRRFYSRFTIHDLLTAIDRFR
jgi:hypothetical protein